MSFCDLFNVEWSIMEDKIKKLSEENQNLKQQVEASTVQIEELANIFRATLAIKAADKKEILSRLQEIISDFQ